MKAFPAAASLLLVASLAWADDPRVVGEYVEARTAEVFAGGCIMNSEAETAGRQAVMAWHITRGAIDGVTLDGLTVTAAVAADRNLGMREMGGAPPQNIRAVVTVDAAASDAQRDALVGLVRAMVPGLLDNIVSVDRAAVRFASSKTAVEVQAGDALHLDVEKEMTHDPSCGAMQWFTPFSSSLNAPAMGVATTHAFSGPGLGSKWSAPHKRSVFWASFAY